MRLTSAALLALAACLWFQFSYVAFADGVRIDVRQLELGDPQVAARLHAQIEKSAWQLCRDDSSPWDVARVASLRRCVAAATEQAVQRANVPTLTAFHLSKKQRGELAGLTHH